jgi:hypothetical protein
MFDRLCSGIGYTKLLVGGCLLAGGFADAFFDIDHALFWWLHVGSHVKFLHETFFVLSIIALLCGVGWYIALLRRHLRMGNIKND